MVNPAFSRTESMLGREAMETLARSHVAVFGPAVMILRQTAAACQTAHDFLQGYVCLLQRALGVGFPRAVVIFATLPAAIEQTHLRPVFHFYDY